MDRLTKRMEDGAAWYNRTPDKEVTNDDILDRLAHYEDLEEQGRLVVLPCALGGKVFDISEFEVYEYSADYIGLEMDNGRLCFVIEGDYFSANELGKTFFSTRAEADAALAQTRKETEE